MDPTLWQTLQSFFGLGSGAGAGANAAGGAIAAGLGGMGGKGPMLNASPLPGKMGPPDLRGAEQGMKAAQAGKKPMDFSTLGPMLKGLGGQGAPAGDPFPIVGSGGAGLGGGGGGGLRPTLPDLSQLPLPGADIRQRLAQMGIIR